MEDCTYGALQLGQTLQGRCDNCGPRKSQDWLENYPHRTRIVFDYPSETWGPPQSNNWPENYPHPLPSPSRDLESLQKWSMALELSASS